MQKIISVFQRNYDGNRLIRDEVVPGAEWVLAGEGRATRKWDGTCCMIQDGVLYKRYDAKRGRRPPEGFIPAQPPDATTGHWPGWIVVQEKKEDRWHREAMAGTGLHKEGLQGRFIDGTYELVGPRINGNPEGFQEHRLIPHGNETLIDCPRTFNGIREWFATPGCDMEGVVFWHSDGRMAKVKKKDFGLRRS